MVSEKNFFKNGAESSVTGKFRAQFSRKQYPSGEQKTDRWLRS